jgi:Domain of unknown function (DUF5666)
MPTIDDDNVAQDLPIAEPLRPTAAMPMPNDSRTPAATATPAALAPPSRSTGPSKLRVGAVAGAAMALAVGGVATAMAASPSSSPTTAANGTTGTQLLISPAFAIDPAIDDLDEGFDHGRMGPGGPRDITVTSISGSSVALKTSDGWTRTITVNDSVTLTKGGQTIAIGDLAVGDQVRVLQTRNDDGTFTVTGLAVEVPSARGTVSDVTSGGFKLTGRDGAVWTITVDGSTKYMFGTADGSIADVTNGEQAIVLGTSTGDNALLALTVRVAPDRVTGKVTSKTASTIVIERRDGTTTTIHVDSDTTYRVAGAETADLGDVTVDMQIGASGRARADGSIDADLVAAGKGGMRGGDGPGGFGRGGRGPGGMGG